MKGLTAKEMAKIDFLAIEKYGITLLQMMELAGYNLAELASRLFPLEYLKVTVLAGKGNNGGGGLSAARHLSNRGASVNVILSQERGVKDAVNHQLHTLEQMKIPLSFYKFDKLPESDVVIDALLGYSLKGNPREPIADMIRKANNHSSPIISLDIPSGLSAATGKAMEPCIKADYTMTLAYPKVGYTEKVNGELYVADIGLPPKLYKEMGLDFPDFFTRNK
jgi:NAD(P)H-hydrate epimerase